MLKGLERDVTHAVEPLIFTAESSSLHVGPSLDSTLVNFTGDTKGYVVGDEFLSEQGKKAVEGGFRPVILELSKEVFETVYQDIPAQADDRHPVDS